MIERRIEVRLDDGSAAEATVSRRESDPTSWLRLAGPGFDETATGADYFASFAEIRRRLARRGILPVCHGASRVVWPSGMSRDMTQGLAAYRLAMGRPASDLVDIFDGGPDVDPVAPEDQEAFSRAWLRSLR